MVWKEVDFFFFLWLLLLVEDIEINGYSDYEEEEVCFFLDYFSFV